ncbi:hypothetical protein BH23VER1_BH23VER1_22350 [soil metagenome]
MKTPALLLGTLCGSVLIVASASAAGPEALIDGDSLAGWETAGGKPAEVGEGWVIEDGGVLHRAGKGGDLLTAKEYGDFELEFEWKIAEGSNSGVKYRVARFGGSLLGIEYQVIDDNKHSDAKDPKRQAASFYAIFAPSPDKTTKEVGEWNTAKIVAKGTVFEHWLNGEKVLEFDTSSPEYAEAKAASKFKDAEGFGQNPEGKILIQDHGDPVWYRNIVITPLDGDGQ